MGLEMRKLKIVGLEWYGWQLWAVLRYFAASMCTRPAMMPPVTWRRTKALPNLIDHGGAVRFCRAREAQAEDQGSGAVWLAAEDRASPDCGNICASGAPRRQRAACRGGRSRQSLIPR